MDDSDLILYYKGREEFDKGNYEGAIEQFKSSIGVRSHAGAYIMLYKCYIILGAAEEAFYNAENAFKENPKGDMIGYEYAKMLMEYRGDREGACEILRQIIVRNPTYKKAAVLLDEILNEQKA